MLIGAQRHVSCFDQGFQCFATHLAWGSQPIVVTDFKEGREGYCYTNYIY